MKEHAKILVADDDRMTREFLEIILKRAGYRVILAEDGVAAVEKAASERPDLVITDGLLPKMHGFVVCKTIKESKPAPKVVVLTGIYTKPTYKWEVKAEYAADDLLTKPITPGDLLACVEKHLGSPALNRSEQASDETPVIKSPGENESRGGPDRESEKMRLAESDASRTIRGWAFPVTQ